LIKLVEAINCPDEPKKVAPKKEPVAKAPVAAKKTAPKASAKKESPKKESPKKESPKKECKKQKQKQKKGKKQQKKGGNDNDQPLITRFDFRVGRIVEVELHPNADSMYLEKIDMGDAEPRVVISGLVKHVPIEEMRDSLVVTFANLKPAKLRGIPSNAMVFAAHGPDGKVELIRPPPGAKVGERIWIEGFENITDFPPDKSINCKKKNAIWNKIKPDLMTNADGNASYQGKVFLCSGGPLKAATIKNGPIS